MSSILPVFRQLASLVFYSRPRWSRLQDFICEIVTENGTITGGPSCRECYIASLYFTMTSLTSVGFGNISANTEGEQIFCIVMLIFGGESYAINSLHLRENILIVLAT